jgi:DNA-binding transcriptional ArsR family regulator
MTLDSTFAALADPTRRGMLERLAAGELSVTQLAQPFHMSLPAVSKHVRVLERAGLVAREKEGRVYRCRMDATPLITVARWVAQYRPLWEQQLEALGTYLDVSKGRGERR